VGTIFRLIWLQDIEYKGDGTWTFAQVRAFWATHTLLLVGMSSSAILLNPGMNLWVFLGLRAFLPLDSTTLVADPRRATAQCRRDPPPSGFRMRVG
jgi:hypothetical protein